MTDPNNNTKITSQSQPSTTTTSTPERHTPFFISLVAGGLAGTTVDIALFPIDTLKTRLQSPQGFLKSGGFRGVYNGLGAAAIGSAPGAALFFSTYETLKEVINNNNHNTNHQRWMMRMHWHFFEPGLYSMFGGVRLLRRMYCFAYFV